MSKGGGTGGSSGGGSSRGANADSKKLDLGLTGRRTLSGNAVTKLIAALGGVSKLQPKSISKVSGKIQTGTKSGNKVDAKSGFGTKSKNQVHVKIQISHAYRNILSRGGGPDVEVLIGYQAALEAKRNGQKTIRAEVIQVGKNGKKTSWIGDVKL